MESETPLADRPGVNIGQIRAQLRLPVDKRVRVMVEAANVLLAVQAHARTACYTGSRSGGGEELDLLTGAAELVSLDRELIPVPKVRPEPFAGTEAAGCPADGTGRACPTRTPPPGERLTIPAAVSAMIRGCRHCASVDLTPT